MANQEHLDILRQGVAAWNQWRKEHTDIRPELRGADLREASLDGAKLSRADLYGADLYGADLSGAVLFGANLHDAHLQDSKLRNADLKEANLRKADLSRADLSRADLSRALLVETILTEALLNDCIIYGIAAWNVQLQGATQLNLVITRDDEPTITVDNLKIAQFIYLLLNNAEIRDVINTITTKVVLILGRFTPERKTVLDALREELRKRNYLPIVFDFEIPKNRDITETVSLLARMSRFVIADLTEARSIPQELSTIIPDLPSVPVQPILLATEREYSMFEHFKRYPWVLQDYLYTSIEGLLAALKTSVIDPAEQKAQELE